jgi:hypothetical protein
MTTLNPAAPLATSSAQSPGRILAVTRLHFVNKWQIIYLPLTILTFVFLANLGIWAIVLAAAKSDAARTHTSEGFTYTGSIVYVFVYCFVIAVQAISRTFPFSLGYGVTRRHFYLGSALTFLILAVGLSAILTIMSVIEIATNGWGLGGRVFAPSYFGDSEWAPRFLLFLLIFLFCLFTGSAIAAIYVRWRSIGMVVFFGILALAIIGGIALLTLTDGWPGFWGWIGDAGALGLALWGLVPTAIAALAGFFILRRATPKN